METAGGRLETSGGQFDVAPEWRKHLWTVEKVGFGRWKVSTALTRWKA